MSQFQSFVITGQTSDSIRKETTGLAKKYDIDIGKTSPDIFFITPFKNSITIGQIRDLKAHIFQKPLTEKYKFVIIVDADSAKTEAQNALLKILEEPPTQAILVLETTNKASLLPTILSRVIVVKTKQEIKASSSLLAENPETALEKIPEIEDAKQFIDDRILALTNQLITDIGSNQFKSVQVSVIEQYKEARQMIAQNVNPSFVLANLILSTNRQV